MNSPDPRQANALAAYNDMVSRSNAPHSFASRYTNWRGKTETRLLKVVGLHYGSTKWHSDAGYLLTAIDLESGKQKDFALADFDFTTAVCPLPVQSLNDIPFIDPAHPALVAAMQRIAAAPASEGLVEALPEADWHEGVDGRIEVGDLK